MFCLLFTLGASFAGFLGASPTKGKQSANEASFYGAARTRQATPSELERLGRQLFFDSRLSASGKLSCASCHEQQHAYAPGNAFSVQLGGSNGRASGLRAVPSLRYLQSVPPFTEHMHDNEGDDSIDQGPAGGRTWDGRASTAHEQALLPLLSPREMANLNPETVVARLRTAGYANAFVAIFGPDVFKDTTSALNAALLALEVFQQTPEEFYPYTSKYDAVLRGETTLTQQEARGLALFNDAGKGNCAACHPSAVRAGALPSFTDYGYVALGVPRNRRLPANSDPRFFDLGLCGPERADLHDKQEYCGLFRTPSLRNVATRRAFFHNGVFHDLEQVLSFYVERELRPEKWYPRDARGRVDKFNDLPVQYHGNVNREPPFDRAGSAKPALSHSEIVDVVAFLRTLTDGYSPSRSLTGAGVERDNYRETTALH